jgi:CheY-like chemotaxis protein
LKRSRNCFLIEDDIEDQEIFQTALQQVDQNMGFMTACNGAEGLNKLKEDPSFVPDFIFLDLNMPKINGLQCLTEIRQLDHLKDTKIIMYSTSSDPAMMEASNLLGANDFLIKPDKLGLLINKLSGILEK